MKKLCLFSSFLIIVFLLFSSTLIFAQHAPCGPGTWEDCGPRTCTPGGKVVEEWCCPSCGAPAHCKDKPSCPGYSEGCTDVSQCAPPDCPGDNCPEMECRDGQCISNCGPCDGDGPTPTPAPQAGTIKGNIWVDTNGNGWQTGEDLYTCSGTQVRTKLELYKAWDSTTPIKTKWPDNGTYEFPNLDPGRYRVKIVRTPKCDNVKYKVTKWRVVTAPCDGGVKDVSDYCDDPYTCADPGETWTLRTNWPLRVCASETTRAHLGIRRPICNLATLSPSSLTLGVGEVYDSLQVIALQPAGEADLGDIDHVVYSAPAFVSLGSVGSGPNFPVAVTGESMGGPENITANIYLKPDDGVPDCSGTAQVTVTPRPAWFQTEGGDVHAQTSIYDPIPDTATEPYCSLLGNGGYPGVVSYGTSYDFKEGSGRGRGQVSPDPFGWLARSLYQAPTYGYDYFAGLIDNPQSLAGVNWNGDDIQGLSGFYIRNGNLRIQNSDANFGNRKIVILVTNSLYLDAKVRLMDNSGFVAFIVKRDININGSLTSSGDNPDLEGVYIADGTINTASTGSIDNQFRGEGMFVSWTNVDFQRNFEDARNDDTPAEEFVFRPDLWINAPKELLKSSYTWQELAP